MRCAAHVGLNMQLCDRLLNWTSGYTGYQTVQLPAKVASGGSSAASAQSATHPDNSSIAIQQTGEGKVLTLFGQSSDKPVVASPGTAALDIAANCT